MAEEKEKPQSKSGGSGKRKRSRRRYFKRKKNASGESGKSEKSEKSGARKDSGSNQKNRSKAQQNRRRRRRSKSRSRRGSSSAPVKKMELDYTPPESVFVYTHVLRPEQRDSYSFRSELSAGTGRTLDDFDIDLSLLFADGSDRIATLIGQVASESDTGLVDEYEAEEQDGERDTEGDTGGDNEGDTGGDNEGALPSDQPAFDETAQANQFQSEDDMPSTFD